MQNPGQMWVQINREAFARDLAAEVPSLEVIVADLADFLMPHARQALHRARGSKT